MLNFGTPECAHSEIKVETTLILALYLMNSIYMTWIGLFELDLKATGS